MLRAIAVVGLILGLIAVGSGRALAECDLLAGPCQWTTSTGVWQVALEALGEGVQGSEYRITVNTPEQPERFLAVLRGESMYMGEYPVPLGSTAEGEYSARFAAPFCTVNTTMTWRVDLQQGQEPVTGIPLKLVFQTEPD